MGVGRIQEWTLGGTLSAVDKRTKRQVSIAGPSDET